MSVVGVRCFWRRWILPHVLMPPSCPRRHRWVDQIIAFIEEVVLPQEGGLHKQIHLVGNSVGGHLAAYVAMRRPDLIKSICLLNPTPVWGLNLPGWSGHLPAPAIPRSIGRFLFDRIRDLKTIERFLEQTYARREAFTDELVSS